jgi:hypothetical protein
MTIHWKALEEHFLMVPLVFQFTHFLNFSQKNSVLNELNKSYTVLPTLAANILATHCHICHSLPKKEIYKTVDSFIKKNMFIAVAMIHSSFFQLPRRRVAD